MNREVSKESAPMRDEKGRFTSKVTDPKKEVSKPKSTDNQRNIAPTSVPPPPTSPKQVGQYVIFYGADDSLFLMSVLKAFREFISDEIKDYLNSSAQFEIKVQAARKLFPEDKNQLKRVFRDGDLRVSFSDNKIW